MTLRYGEPKPEYQPEEWEKVYLLGWYDRQGKGYLTTWGGDLPIYNFVVVGCGLQIPLWDARVPHGAKVYKVPAEKDPREFANELGGYHAIGWRAPVVRRLT